MPDGVVNNKVFSWAALWADSNRGRVSPNVLPPQWSARDLAIDPIALLHRVAVLTVCRVRLWTNLPRNAETIWGDSYSIGVLLYKLTNKP